MLAKPELLYMMLTKTELLHIMAAMSEPSAKIPLSLPQDCLRSTTLLNF